MPENANAIVNPEIMMCDRIWQSDMIRENQMLAWRFFRRKVVSQMRSDCYRSTELAALVKLCRRPILPDGDSRKIGQHGFVIATIVFDRHKPKLIVT